MQQNEKVLLSL